MKTVAILIVVLGIAALLYLLGRTFNLQETTLMADSPIKALATMQQLCMGLTYISETDAPCEAILGLQGAHNNVRLVVESYGSLMTGEQASNCSQFDWDSFWARYVKGEASQSEEWLELKAYVETLHEPKVWKCGATPQKVVLISGLAGDGITHTMVAVRTEAVET